MIPKTPVTKSEIAVLFAEQSKYKVSLICMKDLMHGKHYLANKMKECVNAGSRILVLDCVTQEDLDLIAECGYHKRIKNGGSGSGGRFMATSSRKINCSRRERGIRAGYLK